MGMSIPYEQTGRVNQKARTRAALLDATRELLWLVCSVPWTRRLCRRPFLHEYPF